MKKKTKRLIRGLIFMPADQSSYEHKGQRFDLESKQASYEGTAPIEATSGKTELIPGRLETCPR